MREQEIFLTHEIVVKDAELYSISNPKRLVDKLKTYSNIENIDIIKIGGKVYLELYGTRSMYGYKIEDDGFYDLFDQRYYSKSEFERMQVLELKKINTQTTRKVR